MNSDNRPVGVFDSGVGGLTVVHAIQRLLPNEDLVYLGDMARVPYGGKSPETIIHYSRQDIAFLRSHNVKAVVVACNTATAFALETLQTEHNLPVLGVIEPGVAAALAATHNAHIGIIGTSGTVGSGAYQRALLAARPDLQLTVHATPLLVPLVEEDWLDHKATRLVVSDYLEPFRAAGVDTLVLACTHYPLLKPLLAELLGPDVALVDSADNMALALRQRLCEDNILRDEQTPPEGHVRIHVTDLPPQFEALAHRFLDGRLGRIEKVAL